MRKIIVYILTSDPYNISIDNICDVFDTDDFIIKILTLRNTLQSETDRLSNKDINELERVNDALLRCQKKYYKHYCIVMKDTSICTIDKKCIYDILKDTINLNDWDITYLCRWLDVCESNEPIYSNNKYNNNIIQTYSPHGIQCLMFSPIGRKRILGAEYLRNDEYFTPINIPLDTKLNKHIENGNLVALGYSTNLFMYDSSRIKYESDILKFSLCRIESPKYTIGTYSIYYYITIIGFSALLLIIYHQMRKKSI
uniref:Glycosyltransferase family 25 n=1 Tax=Pithovirus LCPAC102 TaxID=2506587 RepID=A0A481Z541_9VIRU|nr:MAG: glycosyltransferase family 25 [Pithovirus LCPAC102]